MRVEHEPDISEINRLRLSIEALRQSSPVSLRDNFDKAIGQMVKILEDQEQRIARLEGMNGPHR